MNPTVLIQKGKIKLEGGGLRTWQSISEICISSNEIISNSKVLEQKYIEQILRHLKVLFQCFWLCRIIFYEIGLEM